LNPGKRSEKGRGGVRLDGDEGVASKSGGREKAGKKYEMKIHLPQGV